VASLRILQGPELGRLTVEINKPEIDFGRNSDCDVVLPSFAVSRQHFKIIREGDSCYIEDLITRGGTWLNGSQITGRNPLRDGDHIRVCDWVLAFVKDV
jgi:sigma-B regulation protein RsbU (phosphoserine phosphatase)